ncbi:hypothetical protein J5N97_004224 [Dioscorea zingiberensis]|uniref:AB hydrolase-1 domain-containing protein n=1 Tax=Dioscorea zingiberensis TaxID=325984 RepID=A0A9D5D7Z9_9LILI|nr:hypothetical protein J5N97_004224 [Dioscorea zingiberensis]
MVNFVEAYESLLHGLVKLTGLRQTNIEIEPGTVMSFWVPKAKLINNNNNNNNNQNTVTQTEKINNIENENKKKKNKKEEEEKPAVVLLHGCAAEGMLTWQFQVGALTKKYDVYVPDLVFFGASTSTSGERSPEFQARCLVAALGKLGVARCTVVGFSYGGMVAFKMAEMWPELVKNLVISGAVIAMTDSIRDTILERIGFASFADFLLPDSVKGLKALFSVGTHKKIWFPECLLRDYLKVMFGNRKESAELLDGLVISNKDAQVPLFPQRILLLWGENDKIFDIEPAKNMKEQLGEKATLQGIKKAGHLVHLERPCVYNRHLKEFLAQIHAEGTSNK